MRTGHTHTDAREYATELTGFERRLLTGLATVVAAGDDQVAAAAPRGRRAGRSGFASRRRLVAVAVAAAVVAVTMQVVDVGPQVVRERAGGGAPANAAELAALAAKAAESQPTAKPSQWTYVRTLGVVVVPPGKSRVVMDRALAAFRGLHERWQRVDGTEWAYLDGGKVVVRRLPKPSIAVNSLYREVPATTDGALAWAYRVADAGIRAYGPEFGPVNRDVSAFAAIVNALEERPLPPKAEAALYRAAAKIPGITMVKDVRDAAGRRGIALALPIPGDESRERWEIIFDPQTFHYLGSRDLDSRIGIRKSALLENAIVDQPGQRR